MTDTDKDVLDNLESDALALLERATFSIRNGHHAHPVHSDAPGAGRERRLNVVFDSVTEWNGLGEAGVFR